MKDAISWATAKDVAARVARSETFGISYLRPGFEADLERLTAEAESLVAAETGSRTPSQARSRVVDRAEWSAVNLGLLKDLLHPLTSKLTTDKTTISSAAGRLAGGVQLGVVLGWMSSRVLGQYDMPGVDNTNDHDFVYYVAPNVLSLEKRFGFPPEQFRLWIAIHECTHRWQFTANPWLPAHFRELTETLLQDVDSDDDQMKRVLDQVTSVIKQRSQTHDANQADPDELPNAGVMALTTSPKQREALTKLFGLMALLEGHAEVVMSRAGNDRVPSADRFHRVIADRRKQANVVAKTLQKLLGMEAKMKQYAEGAAFVREVERVGGRELLDQVWRSADDLPIYSEIRKPAKWIERHTTKHDDTNAVIAID